MQLGKNIPTEKIHKSNTLSRTWIWLERSFFSMNCHVSILFHLPIYIQQPINKTLYITVRGKVGTSSMGFSSVYEREQFIIDSESQNTHHPDRQSLFLTEEHCFYMCFIYICNTCSPIWKSVSVASAYVKSTLCGPHCSCPQLSEAFLNYAYIVMKCKKKFRKSSLIALIQ